MLMGENVLVIQILGLALMLVCSGGEAHRTFCAG